MVTSCGILLQSSCTIIGVRANIHLGGGGQTEFCPNGFGGGGGVAAEMFRDPYSVGGGGVLAGIFRDPYYSVGCQNFSVNCSNRPKIRVVSPFTTVTDPKFVLFKHVLSFARIMSPLCPNSCRQTARIGGGAAAPLPPPPIPYAYV